MLEAEFCTEVSIMSLWVMTHCSVVGGYLRLGLTCFLHLHAKTNLHNYINKVPVILHSNLQRESNKPEVTCRSHAITAAT